MLPIMGSCSRLWIITRIVDPVYSAPTRVLQATGYEGLMENGTARFTLFAPTNDAWVAAAARLNTTIAAIMSNQ